MIERIKIPPKQIVIPISKIPQKSSIVFMLDRIHNRKLFDTYDFYPFSKGYEKGKLVATNANLKFTISATNCNLIISIIGNADYCHIINQIEKLFLANINYTKMAKEIKMNNREKAEKYPGIYTSLLYVQKHNIISKRIIKKIRALKKNYYRNLNPLIPSFQKNSFFYLKKIAFNNKKEIY